LTSFEYWWWNAPFVPLIVIFGYLTFFLTAGYVYDLRDTRKQAQVVAWLATVVSASILAFGPILEWI
jgi:hypothetical protein